jgi:serine/threonine protein kinase/Tfp pilus assembly protein PilF
MKCSKCETENPATARFCLGCGTPLPPPAKPPYPEVTETLQTPTRELTTGSTFAGRYQVIEELGHGGMGRVYKVHDAELNEKVALKLLRPDVAADPETIERFRNELKSARQVSHKNVCRMFDIGRAEGAPYITMEYVPGEDLKRLIRKIGQMPAGRTVSIARQVCEGLAEAHAHGIIHRDLKPQNIMVDEGGNVRIMDFGIARSLERKSITGAGVMIGTPEYMSPEQVEGKEVDQRSDIYSLGVILYEMATGRVPFEGDTPFTIGVKHKSEVPRDPLELNPAIPPDLDRLILRCLEKSKEKRFQNVNELLDELERIEQALPTTERVVPRHRPLTSKQITVSFNIKKVAAPTIVGVLVLAVALVLWLVVLKKPPIAPPPSGKPSLGVMYFENNTGDVSLDHWRKALAELITADIGQSKYLYVMGSDRLYSILRSENLLDAKSYSSDDMKKVAEAGGVENILRGSFAKAGDLIRINAVLENPKTGEMLGTNRVEARGEQGMFDAVDELTRKIKADFKLTSEQMASDVGKKAAEITTSSPEAFKLYSLGREYHMRGDYVEAVAAMEKAVAIDPGFAMAYRSLAATCRNLGLMGKAKAYLQKAMDMRERASELEKYLIEGDFYRLSEGTVSKAIEAYEKSLQIDPEDVIAGVNLGVSYGWIREDDKAIAVYERYIGKKDAGFLPIWNLAIIYERKGMYEKARGLLEDYAKQNSDSPSLRREVALTYLYEGRLDLARAEAEKARPVAPSDYRTLGLIGNIDLVAGEFEQAEAMFRKSIESTQGAPKAQGMGRLHSLYLAEGKFGKAQEESRRGLELAERAGESALQCTFLSNLGYLCELNGSLGEALKQYERIWDIAVQADDFGWQRRALWQKGCVQVKMNSLAQAQKTADELRDFITKGLNKRAMGFYDNLQGRIELEKKDYGRAIEYFRKALSLLIAQAAGSMDAVFLDPLAAAYLMTGDLENARKTFEAIVSLTSGRENFCDIYARSFYLLGQIDEKLGDKNGARENYRKFLDLWKDADHGLPEVEDARARLAGLK